MKLVLDRFEFTEKSTIGTLTCGDFHCYTLEDCDRYLEIQPEAKQYGKTAIPRGTYRVIVDHSPRFGRMLPHVLDVPGFEGVRIHKGNYPDDTEGCILPGMVYSQDFVGNSREAFATLMELIESCRDDVWLEII